MRSSIHVLICILSICFFSNALAQVDTLWTNVVGGDYTITPNDVIETSDGNLLVTGNVNDYFGNNNFYPFLLKIGLDGEFLWLEAYDDYEGEGRDIVELSEDGYAVSVTTFSNADAALIKTTDSGELESYINYSFSGFQETGELVQLPGGDLVITGYTDYDTEDDDIVLFLADPDGEYIETRRQWTPGDDQGRSVMLIEEGLAVGGFRNIFELGTVDFTLVFFDADGEYLDNVVYGGEEDDKAYAVKRTSDDGYILAGETWSYGEGSSDIYVIKTDSELDTMWTFVYGGDEEDFAASIVETEDSGFLVCGFSSSFENQPQERTILLKLTAEGDTLWTKSISEEGYSSENGSAIQTSEGNYLLVCKQLSLNGPDTDNLMVICYEPESEIGPIVPFNMIAPVNNYIAVSREINLLWDSAYNWWGDSEYSYEVYASNSIDSLYDSQVSTVQVPEYNFEGNTGSIYWWTVKALDIHDHETWANTIRTIIYPEEILSFNLVQPVDGVNINQTLINLSWEITENYYDELDIEYEVYVSEDIETLEENLIATTGINSYEYIGEFNNHYYWSVRAVDENEAVRWSSDIFGFTTDATPQPFNLISPLDNTTLYFTDIMLYWESTSDNDGTNDITYDLFVSENIDNLYDETLISTPDTTFEFTGEIETTYYWTIKASNSADYELPADEIRTFTMLSQLEPFTLVQPEDDSNPATNNNLIELIWQSSHNNALQTDLEYEVYAGNDLGTYRDTYLEIVTDTTYSFEGEYGTQYWWSIRAVDELENQRWVNEDYNFTMAGSPLAFELLFPENQATIYQNPIVLEWQETSDPDEGEEITYQVYLSEDYNELLVNPVVWTTHTSYQFIGEMSTKYWWMIRALDGNTEGTWADEIFSLTLMPLAVDENGELIPEKWSLASLYPNPFNNEINIQVHVPDNSPLRLDIYNIHGQLVTTMVNNSLSPGIHNLPFNASYLPSGIYFIKAEVKGELNETRKIVLMK